MAPFHPNHGLSETTLALLDKGLREIWEDMRVAAELKAKSAPTSATEGGPSNGEADTVMPAVPTPAAVSR